MKKSDDTSGEKFYEGFVKEAPFIPGDHGISPRRLDLPNSDLYDEKLIQKGKEFVRRNFTAVVLSHIVAMLWVIVVRRVRIVLLHTGESHTKEASLKRYLASMIRFKIWYESDFTAEDTRATKDLNAVRTIHRVSAQRHPNLHRPQLPPLSPDESSFLKAVQEATSGIDDSHFPQHFMGEDPQVPISQFDMAGGLFVFAGPLVLYPQAFGVHDTTGMEGFIRLWSLMGRQLGIQDRFNLALHYEETGGKSDAFRLIEQRILMVCLKQTDDTSLIMWKALLEGISEYTRIIRFKPFLQFMLNAMGLPAHLLHEHMDWRDRLSCRIIDFVVSQLTKWAAGRLLCNSFVRFCMWIGERRYLPDRNFGKK